VLLVLTAVVTLPWLAIKYAPVALIIAAALLWHVHLQRRLLVAVLGAFAIAGVAYLWFHQAVYGGWTPYATGDHFVGGEFTAVGDPNLLGRSSRLLGLLVDREFGIASWQPAYLLGVLAFTAAVRWRPPGWKVLSAVAAVGWLNATFVALTMHGWWWPGRQIVVILPVVLLMIAWWVGRSRARLMTTACIGLIGVVATLVLAWEATTGRVTLVVDFFDTSNPLYRAWAALLPDYHHATPATWVLHACWLIVVAGLAVLGYRMRRPATI